MKKFVSIKDVELNEMKKKELVEANGGFLEDIIVIINPGPICGAMPPWPFSGERDPWDLRIF